MPRAGRSRSAQTGRMVRQTIHARVENVDGLETPPRTESANHIDLKEPNRGFSRGSRSRRAGCPRRAQCRHPTGGRCRAPTNIPSPASVVKEPDGKYTSAGRLEQRADRLDPIPLAMVIDEGDQVAERSAPPGHRPQRSSGGRRSLGIRILRARVSSTATARQAAAHARVWLGMAHAFRSVSAVQPGPPVMDAITARLDRCSRPCS